MLDRESGLYFRFSNTTTQEVNIYVATWAKGREFRIENHFVQTWQGAARQGNLFAG